MINYPPTSLRLALATLALCAAGLACLRAAQSEEAVWRVPSGNLPLADTATATPFLPPTLDPSRPLTSPTPDPARALPTPRLEPDHYVVQYGDTLGTIAQRFGVGLGDLIAANQLANPDLLPVGQSLTIPPPQLQEPGPDFKIIPDSELVFGPASAFVDYRELVRRKDGYLVRYYEEVDDENLSGLQIVQRVAESYSVNPLLLLSVLEYQSGWVTRAQPDPLALDYPLGVPDPRRAGLYRQLAWAANELNRGFYLWRVNGVGTWILADGSVVPIAPTLNAGTAGVQALFARLYARPGWDQAVSPAGLFASYSSLFGYPFDLAVEPLLPPDLAQPPLQLPFEPGRPWAFTGGPHGGWDSGSAWAALDFAPPGEPLGCVPSDEWVVAVADGLVVRAGGGAVVQDLDGDGHEQTGWTILYMHIESRDRIQPGAYLRAGERIGHPSCEGWFSTGTHLHIARRYNGEWIPADQSIPFVLDGWTSVGLGRAYDGYLKGHGRTVEACACRSADNLVQR